jgi:hypothetical protein
MQITEEPLRQDTIFTARVTVDIYNKDTGRVMHRTYGANYNAGKVPPDDKTLVRKVLRKIIEHPREVRDY